MSPDHPDQAPPSARALTAHRKHGPEVWAWARADYEAGHPASVVCKAYGIGLSTFRERAAREGWRRQDAEADMRPADLDRLDALTDTDDDPHALALLAWKRFALSVRDGDRLGARAWLRLHRELRREMRDFLDDLELDEDYAALRRSEAEAPFAARAEPASAAGPGEPRDPAALREDGPGAPSPTSGPDDLDDLDGVSDGPPPPAAPSVPGVSELDAFADADPDELDAEGLRLHASAHNLRLAAETGRIPAGEAAAAFAALRAEPPLQSPQSTSAHSRESGNLGFLQPKPFLEATPPSRSTPLSPRSPDAASGAPP